MSGVYILSTSLSLSPGHHAWLLQGKHAWLMALNPGNTCPVLHQKLVNLTTSHLPLNLVQAAACWPADGGPVPTTAAILTHEAQDAA